MIAYKPIDSLRGVFALFIVWHHLCPVLHIPYNADLGNTIVLFFFMLSGFHISLTWKDKIDTNGKEFLIKRCAKIFPIQWITTLLFVLFGINLVSLWAIPFHLSLLQSLNPLWQINFTLNIPSWFLSSLFICYLFTPLLLKYFNHNKKSASYILIGVSLCFTLFVYVLPDSIGRRWLVYINPFSRLIDYSVGMALGLYWEPIKIFLENRLGNMKKVCTLFEILGICSFFFFMLYEPIFILNHYNIVRYPFILLFVMIFTFSNGYISCLLSNKWLNYLGVLSMSIYMTHGFILHFMAQINEFPMWIKVLVSYLCILIFAYVINLILPFISNKIYCLRR